LEDQARLLENPKNVPLIIEVKKYWLGDGGVTQMVEHLPSKPSEPKALNSSTRNAKKKERKKRNTD
jgi:hypothetical protein